MTRSRWLLRSLAVGLALCAPALAASCSGDDDDTKPGSSGGAAGAGGEGGEAPAPPMPIACGSLTCTPYDTPDVLMQPDIPACCASDGRCGLDSSILSNYGLAFGEVCQPKDQAGEVTTECDASAPLMLPGTMTMLGSLKGCCREETGTCGYLLNIGGLIDPGLGCVDSTPFLEGGTAKRCGSGAGGGGGAG